MAGEIKLLKLFNYTNQKLNAENMRKILEFNSSSFGGAIGDESPVDIENNKIKPSIFLAGGLLFELTEEVNLSASSTTDIYVLRVELNSSSSSITTDTYSTASIQKFSTTTVPLDNSTVVYYSPIATPVGSPEDNGYYEYNTETGAYDLSEDSMVNTGKVYYYRYENTSVLFTYQSTQYMYSGNTIWINDSTFIVPICYKQFNGTIKSLVWVRSYADFEKLLSLNAYSELEKYVNETFVWSKGGQQSIGSHKTGDIGQLNVTGTLISKTTSGDIDTTGVNGPVEISKLVLRNLANESNNNQTKLIVTTNGEIAADRNYIEPISNGGTGASTKQGAKINLGITYGTAAPSGQAAEGDIYLQII